MKAKAVGLLSPSCLISWGWEALQYYPTAPLPNTSISAIYEDHKFDNDLCKIWMQRREFEWMKLLKLKL